MEKAGDSEKVSDTDKAGDANIDTPTRIQYQDKSFERLELAVTELNQSIVDILNEGGSTSTIEISEEESNHLLNLAMGGDGAEESKGFDMGDGSNIICEDLGWEQIEQMLADVNQEIEELKNKVGELHSRLEEQMSEIENEQNAFASGEQQDKQVE